MSNLIKTASLIASILVGAVVPTVAYASVENIRINNAVNECYTINRNNNIIKLEQINCKTKKSIKIIKGTSHAVNVDKRNKYTYYAYPINANQFINIEVMSNASINYYEVNHASIESK